MGRVGRDAHARLFGLVELLGVERSPRVRHRPVAEAPARRLPVELEIGRVPRVADLARPDLLRAARVACEEGEAPGVGPGAVDQVGRARRRVPLRRRPAAPRAAAGGRSRGRPGHEVRVDERVDEPPRGEEGWDRAARDPPAVPGRHESPGGRSRALGEPEAVRGPAEVATVSREADVDLSLGGRVGREEREEAVRRRRGDRFDPPRLRQPGERGDEVPAESVEEREPLFIVGAPGARERLGFVAVPRELARVAPRRPEPVRHVPAERAREARVAQLLAEDRRQADRRLPRDPLGVELTGGGDEREVRLGRRLVQPVGSVRPDPVAEDRRHVAVEDEDEGDGGHGLLPEGRGRARGTERPSPGPGFRRRSRAAGRRSSGR